MKEQRELPLGFIAVAFVLVSLFAAWVHLGPGQLWLEGVAGGMSTQWTDFASWYQRRLESSAKLLAPLITIVSGTYAIVKAYKYAETRLHRRLHDFLQREEARLSEARATLRMMAEKPGVRRKFVEPSFLNEHFRRAVREMGWGSYFLPAQMGLVEYQLGSAISQLERQSSLGLERQRHFDRQLATAHLLKGALFVSDASKAVAEGRDDRLGLTNAASHFSAALHINPTDEEALEYLSQVHVRLGQNDKAAENLERLLQLTAKQDKSLVRARALHSSARLTAPEIGSMA